MRILVTVLRLAGAAYVALFGLLYLVQDKILYNIDPVRTAPSAVGLGAVHEIAIRSPDGARLIAWHAAARSGQPTLL